MLIICPSCATSYDVEAASLQPKGRQVRCVRCRTIWLAEPSQADKLMAAAAALSPLPGEADVVPEVRGEAPNLQPLAEPPAMAAMEIHKADHLPDVQPDETPSVEPVSPPATAEPLDSADELNKPAVVEAPPIVAAAPGQAVPANAIEPVLDAEQNADPPEDIESVAARRYGRGSRRKKWNWSMPRLQAAVLAMLIIDSTMIGWRTDVVRILPQTASFFSLLGLGVNLRGLTFDGVTTSAEQHDGVPVLVVEGNIVNDSRNTVDVPRLKLEIRNAAKQEIYSWTAGPPRAALLPGEKVGFHTRLASAPPESRDVLVRFVNRHDTVAGLN